MRRPARFAAIGIMAVLVMAAPAVDLRLGLDSGADAISQAPAGRGLEVLTEKFSEGALSPTQVVVRTTGPAFSSAQLASVDALTDSIADTPGVASATSITSIASQTGVDLRVDGLDPLLQRTHSDEFATLVNADNGANTTTISVIPDAAIDSENAREVVDTIRHDLADDARDVGLAVNVTGPTAHINDLAEEITHKLPWVLAYVLAMSFLLLTAVFRSPLLSLKALFMNLLSVGAAYGVLVWVFQWGNGGSLLGFESTGAIQAYLPILAFAILFGISMDYEVFLLGRIREEWLRTGDNTAAVADGLAHTAGPITSAAAIQCVVFGAFVFTRVIDVKQVGFALAIAIVIDATLIRIVLVPATMRLMGRWNWWTPRWLDRLASMTSARPPTPIPVGTVA
jgi:RND superfamily putative drug exporter